MYIFPEGETKLSFSGNTKDKPVRCERNPYLQQATGKGSLMKNLSPQVSLVEKAKTEEKKQKTIATLYMLAVTLIMVV